MLRDTLRRRLNFTLPATVGDKHYRIPVWGGMETPGVSDSWHVELWRRLIPLRPGVFVDGGMNLGQTLLRVRAAADTVPYVGFEPNSSCVAYLEHLIEENGLHATTVVPAGLSNQAGFLKLHVPRGEPTHEGATLVDRLRPGSGDHVSSVVPVCVFDDVADELGARPAGVVKIDVEGHELEALSGMRKTLGEDRPVAVIEVLPRIGATTPEGTKDRGRRLIELASGEGYSIRRIVPTSDSGTEIHLEEFEGFLGLPFDPRATYDYLFFPDELASEVQRLFQAGGPA